MEQKTKPKKTTEKGKRLLGGEKAEVRPEEMISLLKEIDEQLSFLVEAYNQYREASQSVMEKLDHWEERFDQLESVVSRLGALESEVRELTRGYLERIEAMEKRQANIEELERRLEREAA